jgi:hypothetical protein
LKKLILLFTTFLLYLSGTNVWAAKGVDCSSIDLPDLSGYVFKKKWVYDDKRLGVSQKYQRDSVDVLTYYSYDNGYDSIDKEILDSHLTSAFQNIVSRYSSDIEKNHELQDDAQYLNTEKFNELGMQKFVNQGIVVTSIAKNSAEFSNKVEVVAVGTDGYCIHKVRWTTRIHPEDQLHNVLEYFVGLLDVFYKGLKFKGLYN